MPASHHGETVRRLLFICALLCGSALAQTITAGMTTAQVQTVLNAATCGQVITVQAVTKWGTVQNLMGRRGYKTVTSSTRYWVLSTTGNDGTCASHTFGGTPDPTSITACATFAHLEGLITAGDVVFWRGGTYTEEIFAYLAPTGTATAPIIYMSYPGELATINAITGADICAAGLTPDYRNYITFDGFKFTYTVNNTDGDRAINICTNSHLILRHNEVGQGLGRGFYGGAGDGAGNVTDNALMEYNVIYDQNLYGQKSHGMYIVNRSDSAASPGMIIRNNIGWNPGRTCIQVTGPWTNITYDGNVCYKIPFDSAAGFVFEQGVNNSTVRGNLCFDADNKCFNISDYASTIATNLAHDQKNNIIENNTFVVPATKWEDGTANNTQPVVWIGSTIPCGTVVDLGHNTFRNNLLIDKSGLAPLRITTETQDDLVTYAVNGQQDPRAWAATLTWQNNDVWQLDGSSNILEYTNHQSTIGTSPCGVPALISGDYTVSAWAALNGTTTGNLQTDPLFTTYNEAGQLFDFRPQGTSPALLGSTTQTGNYDLLGNARGNPATMGAYEYQGAGTAITVNDWNALPAPSGWNSRAAEVGYDALRYIGSRRLHVEWDNFKQDNTTEINQALIGYSYEENRWHVLQMHYAWKDAHVIAPGHSVSAFGYDPDDNILLFQADGSGSQQQYERLPGDWEWYDFGGLSGQIKTFSPRPWLMSATTSLTEPDVYDTIHHRLIMFSQQGSNVDNVYTCSISANSCSQITLTGTMPTTPGGFGAVFNPDNGKLYIYGGGQAGIYTLTCTATDCSTATVAQLTTTCAGADCTSNAPPTRLAMGFAYSFIAKKFLMAGGGTGYGAGLFTDTWTFDPSTNAWAELSPAHVYTNGIVPSNLHDRLSFDEANNVFLLENNSTAMYAFALSAAPNVGRVATNYSPTSGSLNHIAPNSYAFNPFIVGGANLYGSWIETGTFGSSSGCQRYYHPYVSQLSGGTWAGLPTYSSSSCTALDSEASGEVLTSSTKLGLVGSTLWETHEKSDQILPVQAYAYSWNGSAWSGGAIGCFSAACSSSIAQHPMSIIGVGSTPTVAVIEANRVTGFPDSLFVAQFSSSWNALGSALNRNASSQAQEASLGTDGTHPAVAWSEMVSDRTTNTLTPQCYVSQWTGSAWSSMGGSLNQSAGDWCSYPVLTYVGGSYYVAFTERAVGGNQLLFVKQWNGSAWNLVGGGALNINTATGWAAKPSLTNDGTNVDVGWDEQDSLGALAKAYVKQWNGSAWSQLGSALNADPINGSATEMNIAYVSGTSKLYAMWAEMKYGNLQQIYSVQVGASPSTPAGQPSVVSSGVVRSGEDKR